MARLYSVAQRDLFIHLLELRQRRDASIAGLARGVVFLWATRDEHDISTEQVRRALATWADRRRYTPQDAADRSAARETRRLRHPDAKRAQARSMRVELADYLHDHAYDSRHMPEALRAGLDPARSGSPRGPRGAELSVAIYELRLRAISAAMARSGAWRDDELLDARSMYRSNRENYMQRQPGFREDPDIGDLFQDSPDRGETDICSALVMLIGMEELRRNRRKSLRK